MIKVMKSIYLGDFIQKKWQLNHCYTHYPIPGTVTILIFVIIIQTAFLFL